MPIKRFDHKALSKQLRALAPDHTMKQAAEKLELRYNDVAYICQKNRISFRKRGGAVYNAILQDEDIPLIKELAAEGVPKHIIAKKFECSHNLIRKVCNGNARTTIH